MSVDVEEVNYIFMVYLYLKLKKHFLAIFGYSFWKCVAKLATVSKILARAQQCTNLERPTTSDNTTINRLRFGFYKSDNRFQNSVPVLALLYTNVIVPVDRQEMCSYFYFVCIFSSKKKTQEGLRIIIISSVSFAVTVTIALIITIFLGPPAVSRRARKCRSM